MILASLVRRLAGVRALRAILALCVLGSLLLVRSVPLLAKPKDPVLEITSQLICPCSCGEVVSGCICETGMSMKATVERDIKAGKSKDEIIGALVSQYGEVIRGAPKPQGFNLIVWIAPFAATLLGFAIASFILRRWVRRRSELATAAARGGSADAGAFAGAAGPRSPFLTGRTLEEDVDALRARAEAELRRLKQGREA